MLWRMIRHMNRGGSQNIMPTSKGLEVFRVALWTFYTFPALTSPSMSATAWSRMAFCVFGSWRLASTFSWTDFTRSACSDSRC